MPRVAIVLGLALVLVGCGSAASSSSVPSQGASGEAVALLTDTVGCYAGGEESGAVIGVLVPEPSAGTAIRRTLDRGDMPILWPLGYTARRVGTEIEVLDTHGEIKATTGRTYFISPGMPGGKPGPRLVGGALPAAADCGYPWDFIDCTATAADTGEPFASDGKHYNALGQAKSYCELQVQPTPVP
jgi:hypothetical protein